MAVDKGSDLVQHIRNHFQHPIGCGIRGSGHRQHTHSAILNDQKSNRSHLCTGANAAAKGIFKFIGILGNKIRAAAGKADAYLTFSSGELSFLREIKNAYGNHVATIFNFIEDKALEQLTNSINAPDSEKLERLAMGKTLKNMFLQ